MMMGVNTKRGPISSNDMSVSFLSPWVSWIWKLRNQILPSARVKERTWSMKGFDFRALLLADWIEERDFGGTPKM